MFPANDKLRICFAHVAYRLHERFSALDTGIDSFAARDRETLEKQVGEADVLVISGLWHDGLLEGANRLRFIQAIGAGTDQFPRAELAQRGIRLASARGVNHRAVAEHAMALILALSRRLPEARDNQAKRVWRGMIGDPARREDELGGKTLLVVGLGQIGGRLAQIAKAFDMRVVGLRRNPAAGRGAADAVYPMGEFGRLAQEADFIALTCPLTDETENLVDAATRNWSISLAGASSTRRHSSRRSPPAASPVPVSTSPWKSRSHPTRRYGGWSRCSSPRTRRAKREHTKTM